MDGDSFLVHVYFVQRQQKVFFNSLGLYIASSSHSVSQGAAQKAAREKIKNVLRDEAKERLWV